MSEVPTKKPHPKGRQRRHYSRLLDDHHMVLIEEAVRAGIRIPDIAPLVGTYPTQFNTWIDKGKTDFEEGKGSIFSELYQRIEKARVERTRESLLRIRKAASGSEMKEIERIKDGNNNVIRTKERVTVKPQWEADIWLLENVDGFKQADNMDRAQNTSVVFVEVQPNNKKEEPK